MKVRRPKQSRSKATVEAILEATSQVLRREGLDAVTTAKVAKRAGVSVGSLYQYFPNKQALFDALIDRHLELLQRTREQAVMGIAAAGDLLEEVIPNLVHALLEIHKADPDLQRQLHLYEVRQGLGRLQAFKDAQVGVAAAVIRLRQEELRVRDPDLAALVLVNAFGGVVEPLARRDPRLLARADLRHELAALLVGYLSVDNPVGMAAEPADGSWSSS